MGFVTVFTLVSVSALSREWCGNMNVEANSRNKSGNEVTAGHCKRRRGELRMSILVASRRSPPSLRSAAHAESLTRDTS